MELISYKFLYLDISFLIHSLMYLVVIFLACIFDGLASIALLSKSSFGGGGILVWVWLFNSCIFGCIRQFLIFFVMYITFLIRWYVLICLFSYFL